MVRAIPCGCPAAPMVAHVRVWYGQSLAVALLPHWLLRFVYGTGNPLRLPCAQGRYVVVSKPEPPDEPIDKPDTKERLYPAFLSLRGKTCVVVGGGRVAARKVRALLSTGAHITVISPLLHAD